MRNWPLLLIVTLSLLSCAERQTASANIENTNQHRLNNLELISSDQIVVVDGEDKPIANASVMIGMRAGDPFEGNTLVTDAAGKVSLPLNWKSPLPVTVQAEGYIALTLPRKSPDGSLIRLERREGQNKIEIKGETTGFGRIVDHDGKVDFGLVLQSFQRNRLMYFDLSSVLSSETDVISIGPKSLALPSNITLPPQKERYAFIPVNLNKPIYRTYVRDADTYRFTATHGSFPLKRVVDEMRGGKSIYDLINHFDLDTFGSVDVPVTGNIAKLDVPISTKTLDKSITIQAPQMERSQVMMSFSLALENNQLTPMDLKKTDGGGSLTLKTNSTVTSAYALSILLNTTGASAIKQLEEMMPLVNFETDEPADRHILAVVPTAVETDFKQLSMALQPISSPNPTFLPIVEKPTVSADQVNFTVPTMPAGFRSVATYAVFSEVVVNKNSKIPTETRTRLWQMVTSGWVNAMPLPALNFTRVPGRTYRWEVLFLAKPSADTASDVHRDGTMDLTHVTHVTRASVDVQ